MVNWKAFNIAQASRNSIPIHQYSLMDEAPPSKYLAVESVTTFMQQRKVMSSSCSDHAYFLEVCDRIFASW